MQRLTDALDFQSQALVLRAERQRLIASNIANADTPGYQAREMDFANALRQATVQGGSAGPTSAGGVGVGVGVGALATTHPAHDDASVNLRADPGLLYARHSQDSIDRNTVDLDRERASFVDNTIKYEATLRFINGSVRSMLDAMKSVNQG
jgi:flagellar basal-body rod protein FlgB